MSPRDVMRPDRIDLCEKRSYKTVLRRDSTVRFPSSLTGWKAGQRVFFCLRRGTVEVSVRPQGMIGGRLRGTTVTRTRVPVWTTLPPGIVTGQSRI